MNNTRFHAPEFLIAAGLFAIVLGARWLIVSRFSTVLPIWDQWDAEGTHLFVPLQEGSTGEFLRALFRPHNEHRVVWTKLLSLAEVALNGQWDARLQCTVNALLHACVATAGWLWLRRRIVQPLPAAMTFTALCAMAALPLAWENLINGFNSQQIILTGLSLGAVALVVGADPGSRRWWAGFALAAAALFAMASGLLASVAIGVGTLLDSWRSGSWRRHWPTLAAAGVVVLAGFAMQVEVPFHASLKAATPGDFLLSLSRSLQWPAQAQPLFAAVFWLPWILLVVQVLRKREASTSAIVLVAMGSWVLFQYAAAAYARGVEGAEPQNRYLDTIACGLALNAAMLSWQFQQGSGRAWRPGLAALAILWVALLAPTLRKHVLHNLGDLATIRDQRLIAEQATAAYLSGGNPARLHASVHLPYPNATEFIARIAPESIRGILPHSVRPGLAPGRAARAANVVVGGGHWLLAGGALAVLGGAAAAASSRQGR